MLQLFHEPHGSSPADVHEEVIQTAAMALRVAMSLDRSNIAVRRRTGNRCRAMAMSGRPGVRPGA